jgi:hypothetical protein
MPGQTSEFLLGIGDFPLVLVGEDAHLLALLVEEEPILSIGVLGPLPAAVLVDCADEIGLINRLM